MRLREMEGLERRLVEIGRELRGVEEGEGMGEGQGEREGVLMSTDVGRAERI